MNAGTEKSTQSTIICSYTYIVNSLLLLFVECVNVMHLARRQTDNTKINHHQQEFNVSDLLISLADVGASTMLIEYRPFNTAACCQIRTQWPDKPQIGLKNRLRLSTVIITKCFVIRQYLCVLRSIIYCSDIHVWLYEWEWLGIWWPMNL